MSQPVLPLLSSSLEPIKTYYAVRRGHQVKNCIFLSWEDCKRHVEGSVASLSGVEYRAFTDFYQAEQYLFPNDAADSNPTFIGPPAAFQADVAVSTITAVPPPVLLQPSAPDPLHVAPAPAPVSTRKNHNKPGTKWMIMFNKLQQIYQENGHTQLPENQRELIAWCKKQRAYYRLMTDQQRPSPMTTFKVQLLTSIGFSFEGETAQTAVNLPLENPPYYPPQPVHLAHIATFQVPLGDLKPAAAAAPADTDIPTSTRLYRPTKHWNRCFDRLQAYKLSHNGSIEIPKTDTENADLHQWCTEQQAQFKAWKLGKGNYLQEKIERMESLGFVFNYKSWDERIQMLLQYREQKIRTMQNRAYGRKTFATYGIIKIPESHPELGKW
jgi:hypothetical protein